LRLLFAIGTASNRRGKHLAISVYRTLARLTRLICFDRHNRFDHHDFRVMAAGTSTVWAFLVNLTAP
jgi:hypothetical protein